MARSNSRSRNNNPTGRNQYSGGWMDTAKERPMTTAAAAAAAVGAGVFLWSKRNQISEQLTALSDQISDWTENMRSSQEQDEFETGSFESGSTTTTGSSSPSRRSNRKSQQQIAEEALTLKETGAV